MSLLLVTVHHFTLGIPWPCLFFIFQRVEVRVCIFLPLGLAIVDDLLNLTLAMLAGPLP